MMPDLAYIRRKLDRGEFHCAEMTVIRELLEACEEHQQQTFYKVRELLVQGRDAINKNNSDDVALFKLTSPSYPTTAVVINVIPHNQHRYPTVGDWIWHNNGTLEVRVSQLENWYSMLIAIHELVEAWLCRHRGIAQKSVDEFDLAFERDRDLGDESEPGDAPNAPYRREHRQAENIERLLADYLGVDWREYEAAIAAL